MDENSYLLIKEQEQQAIKDHLIKKGFREVKLNLFLKEIESVTLWCDFRNGKDAWMYGFDDKGNIDHTELDDYKELKAMKESRKHRSLDEFQDFCSGEDFI